MGKLREMIFEIQKKNNISRLSREADYYATQLDRPELTAKIEAAGKLNEITAKLMKLSVLQVSKEERIMQQRTQERLREMQSTPNPYLSQQTRSR